MKKNLLSIAILLLIAFGPLSASRKHFTKENRQEITSVLDGAKKVVDKEFYMTDKFVDNATGSKEERTRFSISAGGNTLSARVKASVKFDSCFNKYFYNSDEGCKFFDLFLKSPRAHAWIGSFLATILIVNGLVKISLVDDWKSFPSTAYIPLLISTTLGVFADDLNKYMGKLVGWGMERAGKSNTKCLDDNGRFNHVAVAIALVTTSGGLAVIDTFINLAKEYLPLPLISSSKKHGLKKILLNGLKQFVLNCTSSLGGFYGKKGLVYLDNEHNNGEFYGEIDSNPRRRRRRRRAVRMVGGKVRDASDVLSKNN